MILAGEHEMLITSKVLSIVNEIIYIKVIKFSYFLISNMFIIIILYFLIYCC